MHLAYVNLGFALAAQAKEKDARRAFEQVLKPGEVLNNLALAAEMRGVQKRLENCIRKRLPTSPTSHGGCFKSQGDGRIKPTKGVPMKSMSITGLILLTGALMVLPGCAARDALAPTSGRSVKLVFKQQAKKRSTMRIAR